MRNNREGDLMIENTTIRRILVAMVVFLTPMAISQPVLDLGVIGIEGSQRGPELKIIDPKQVTKAVAQQLVGYQLKEIERELLVPEDPCKERSCKP